MSFFKSKYEVQLDSIINSLEMNMSNNYKDNAQDNLRELEDALTQMKNDNVIKEKKLKLYEDKLASYKNKMKGYTHKDQKPYWT